MASLKSCRSCSGTVAKNAIQCPSCGKVNPSPGILRKLVNLAVLALFVAVAVALVAAQSANY